VHPGIDPDDFPIRAQVREDWRWRLLYVGRVIPDKGVATLIRALALLPAEATLDVLGDAEPAHAAELQQLAREFDVHDRVWFGKCARSELAERYAAADVVVFPSEWDEPFGLVPIEAMACGTPTVASGTGGSAEFLFDGDNCVLFTPGDSASLAEAVERLASDRALRERIVAAGFRTAEYFDASHLADAYEQWFVAAAAGYRDGHPASRHFTLDTIRA
jgi:glycosyltransferase involved in cell wall biosynthesis